MSTPAPVCPSVTKTCAECGAKFVIELTDGPNGFVARATKHQNKCSVCVEAEVRREEDQKAARKLDEIAKAKNERWHKLCPPLYQEIDLARLPRPDLFGKVMEWKYGPKGLLLSGITGLGKSRCAWMLVEREFDSGKRIVVLDYMSALRYGAMFSRSCEEAEAWLDKTIAADILFLDDAFKSKFSDSYEQALFAIVEQRGANLRPIIVTSNDTATTLASRLSEDRGQAFIRRLKEFCEPIPFV